LVRELMLTTTTTHSCKMEVLNVIHCCQSQIKKPNLLSHIVAHFEVICVQSMGSQSSSQTTMCAAL
jgi:hypothetical protein